MSIENCKLHTSGLTSSDLIQYRCQYPLFLTENLANSATLWWVIRSSMSQSGSWVLRRNRWSRWPWMTVYRVRRPAWTVSQCLKLRKSNGSTILPANQELAQGPYHRTMSVWSRGVGKTVSGASRIRKLCLHPEFMETTAPLQVPSPWQIRSTWHHLLRMSMQVKSSSSSQEMKQWELSVHRRAALAVAPWRHHSALTRMWIKMTVF